MEAIIQFLHAIFGLICLYLLWHYGFRSYLLDRFRAELFEIRDELFDYAHAGNIPFDDPNYRAVRQWLNGVIRLAHRIEPLDTGLMVLLGNRIKDISPEAAAHADRIESISNGKHGPELQRFVNRSFYKMGTYMVARSPMMWVVVLGLFAFAIARKGIQAFGQIPNIVLVWLGRKAELQVSFENRELGYVQ